MGILYKEILKNDLSEIDPKMHIKVYINNMHLYTAPSRIDSDNTGIWLEHTLVNFFSFKTEANDVR